MDINATLRKIRELGEKVRALGGRVSYDDALALAEAVGALDDWLSRGGFLPDDWSLR